MHLCYLNAECAELECVVWKHNGRHTCYSIVHGCVVPKFCKKNAFYKANRDESVSQSESICILVMISQRQTTPKRAHSPCTVPYHTSSLRHILFWMPQLPLTCKTKVFVTFNTDKNKKKIRTETSHSLASALTLTLTVTLSPNRPVTRHCWWLWCTALPLTHQPTWQYNTTRRIKDVNYMT